MKTKVKLTALGVSASFVALAVVGGQLGSTQSIDTETIKQQLHSLNSYSNESTLILGEYENNHIPFTYVKTQSEHINKKVIEFYDTIASSSLPDSNTTKVKDLEPLAFELSLNLVHISSSEGDKEKLKKIENNLKKLQTKIKEK